MKTFNLESSLDYLSFYNKISHGIPWAF